jgi:glycerophosphoryl diester phosphodiesterase
MIFIVGAAVLAGMIAFYLFLLAPAQIPSSSDVLWQTHYAHRGLYHKDQSIPENSLAAFAEAANAGYGIEMDLTITADDQIVVFHDDTLLRACGVQQNIRDCTYDGIRSYRLFGTDEGIPLFSESLDLVKGRVPLIVELKHIRRYQALCAKAAALLDDYKGLYCIESFDPRIVRWFMKNRPDVVRGQLSASVKSYEGTPFYQALLMSALLSNVTTRPHFVAYRHQDARCKLGLKAYRFLGGKLVAWTVQNAESMEKNQRIFHTIIFEYFRP